MQLLFICLKSVIENLKYTGCQNEIEWSVFLNNEISAGTHGFYFLTGSLLNKKSCFYLQLLVQGALHSLNLKWSASKLKNFPFFSLMPLHIFCPIS